MKESTFKMLLIGLMDQIKEDKFKSDKFSEIFREEFDVTFESKINDTVFNAVMEEYDLDDYVAGIIVDVIWNEALAFKHNGEIIEGSVENLYKLVTNLGN